MNEAKFYVCEHCGNIVEKIHDSGVNVVCCGEKMKKLEAGVTEASREKHIPEVCVEGGTVKAVVGSVAHPMSQEHHISWIYLVTDKGTQRKALDPTGEPVAVFALAEGEKPIAVYAYCNLHGLWMAEI